MAMAKEEACGACPEGVQEGTFEVAEERCLQGMALGASLDHQATSQEEDEAAAGQHSSLPAVS